MDKNITLSEKQRIFTRLTGLLISYIYDQGYEATFGETWRDPRIAELNAKTGTGIKNSLHTRRLAVDLNLFKNGVYLTDTKDYDFLGKFWKKLSAITPGIECCWGGDFKTRPDGNHFSIADGGQK